MLMTGPYPYILKQRVVSDKGHLSNEQSGNYLKERPVPPEEGKPEPTELDYLKRIAEALDKKK